MFAHDNHEAGTLPLENDKGQIGVYYGLGLTRCT